MNDPHLFDEGRLSGLTASQQQYPVLFLSTFLVVLEICKENNNYNFKNIGTFCS
jgi:hypothetical protein